MGKRRAVSPFRWLRRGLLVFLIAVVGAVTGLYLFGRAGRPPAVAPAPGAGVPNVPGADVTTVGQGFEYTHYEEGRPVFFIRADRTLEDRQETVYLEGVALTLYQEDGSAIDLAARRADYHRESQEALLEGDVRLRGGGGLEVDASGLELGQRGRLLTSVGPVDIRWGDEYRGRGDRMRIHLPEDLYLLAGDVTLDNVPDRAPPLSLRTERITFERSRQLFRADGGVEIHTASDEIRARSINVFLDPQLTGVRFLRARWEVSGRRVEPMSPAAGETGPPGSRVMEFSGRSLSVLLRSEGSEVESAQLEGTPEDPAVLRNQAPDGTLLVISAGYLSSGVAEDGVQVVEAFGDPELVETVTGDASGGMPVPPRRRLRGGRAQAELSPDGTLERVRLSDGVDYRDAELEVLAEMGRILPGQGKGEFFGAADDEAREGAAGREGEAVEQVRLRRGGGELLARRVAFDREEGVIHAMGQVFTRLPGSSGVWAGSPFGGGSEPVRVESDEVLWRDSPEDVLFRGRVRAWQGESVVLAGWLRSEGAEGKISAGEGVRTVVIPEDGGGGASALMVAARGVEYLRDSGELAYQGEVQAEQEGHKLSCDRLRVSFTAGSRAERLDCLGTARLEDPPSGYRAEAERAVYEVAAGRMDLYGSPAVVRDPQGGSIEAAHVTYDVEDGRVTAAVQAEEPGG